MLDPGYSFEGYVQYVFQCLLNLKGEGIVVSQRTTLIGRAGSAHELDIFYQFKKAGVPHRVAIECKDWKEPIPQGRVKEFESTLRDIPDVRGVMISRTGYQDGARKYGESQGILMLTADDLPRFGALIGTWIEAYLLPDEESVGEPFWCIVEVDEKRRNQGVFYCLPKLAFGGKKMVPLFTAKTHAELFMDAWHIKRDSFGVRGIARVNLRAYLMMTEYAKVEFVSYVCAPREFKDARVWIRIPRDELDRDYAHKPETKG